MSAKHWMKLGLGVLVCGSGVGCVQRTLTIETDPPGALVFLNDQEFGRTPVTRAFTWYGYYDVEIRKSGFQSIKTTAAVIAPWWQWVPFDFFAEVFPATDHHTLRFTLRPPNERDQEADLLVKRGEDLATRLETGIKPATRPHQKSKPEKAPTTQPTTKP